LTVERAHPVLYFDDKIVVTLGQGLEAEAESESLRTALGEELHGRDAGGLVIDVSAVTILDSHLTRVVRDLALMAKLMGVRTAVCGLRPAIAITLVEMGLELPGVHTALSLDHAVRWLSSPPRRRPAERGRDDGSR
jgi:rsbT antagonist protein RsbS